MAYLGHSLLFQGREMITSFESIQFGQVLGGGTLMVFVFLSFAGHISFFALFYTENILLFPFFHVKYVLFFLFSLLKKSFFPLRKVLNQRGTPVIVSITGEPTDFSTNPIFESLGIVQRSSNYDSVAFHQILFQVVRIVLCLLCLSGL